MSLFKSYTPKYLYLSTLTMINTLFARPPVLDLNPSSYFKAGLSAHDWIRNDLSGVVRSETPTEGDTTLDQVHESLTTIERMLFGTKSDFECSVKGCCLYTEHIEMGLKSSITSCVVT